MSYGYDFSRLSVDQRRRKAAKFLEKQKLQGKHLQPVLPIEGTQITTTYWGKAWCENLEKQAHFTERLSGSRMYARHGAIVDLRIEEGKILSRVLGSQIYKIKIQIKPLEPQRWKAMVKRCQGNFFSLMDFTQGRLCKAVMQPLLAENSGLLPTTDDMTMKCSCPDWAKICKHLGAVLYGVGIRLDSQPELLFALRQVDHTELMAQTIQSNITQLNKTITTKLQGVNLSALFDIDLIDTQLVATAPKKKLISKSRSLQASQKTRAKTQKIMAKKTLLGQRIKRVTRKKRT